MSIYNPLPVLKGMWTTFKSIFEKPVTIQYPEQKRVMTERFKGRVTDSLSMR